MLVNTLKDCSRTITNLGNLKGSKFNIRWILVIILYNFHSVESSCDDMISQNPRDDYTNYGTLTAVEKSLVIQHLDEGIEHKDIFNLQYEDCEYSLVEHEPNREYFQINRKNKTLNTIALDREDEAFESMLIPQIRVQLQLICPNGYPHPNPNRGDRKFRSLLPSTSLQSNGRYRGGLPTKYRDRSYVLTRDIEFSPLTTFLTIIIEDINDHSPEFVYPPETNFLIGYPEGKVSDEIFPHSLLQVSAIDRDANLNALIRYRIETNNDFGINSETGEIFPYWNAMQNDEILKLKVFAVDRNGSDDGRRSTVDIKVKRLTSDDLALLTLREKNPEDFDTTLDMLKIRTGINLRILKRGLVSGNLPTKSPFDNKNKEKKILLKAWVYAFDSNEKPIEGAEIERKISQIGESICASAMSYKKMKEDNEEEDNKTEDENNIVITLIIVIVLLLLLIIALIVGFVTWYCLRYQKYKRISTPSSTMTTISSISADLEDSTPSPQQQDYQPHFYLNNNNNHNHHHNNHHYQHHRLYNSTSHKRNSIMKPHRDSLHHQHHHSSTSSHKSRDSILKDPLRSTPATPRNSEDIQRFARKLHNLLGDVTEYHPAPILEGIDETIDIESPRLPQTPRKSSVTFDDNVKFISFDSDEDDSTESDEHGKKDQKYSVESVRL